MASSSSSSIVPRIGGAPGIGTPAVSAIVVPLIVLAVVALQLWSGAAAVVAGGLVTLALLATLAALTIAGVRLGYDETGRDRP